jgi:hypothetical protein
MAACKGKMKQRFTYHKCFISAKIYIKLRKQNGDVVQSFDMELKDQIYYCTYGI